MASHASETNHVLPVAWRQRLGRDLAALHGTGAYRALPSPEDPAARDAKWKFNLSSNDYLGLSRRTGLWKEFLSKQVAESDAFSPFGACSSRLLDGNRPENALLEAAVSAIYGGRSVLVLGSGYHANVGLLSCLAGKGDLILGDKLNHASLIDGMRLCEAELRRYPHLDYDHLDRRLAKDRRRYDAVFLVSESVFSMDGDAADLRRLVELKYKYDAVLVVDEAHAVGVFGPQGAGLSAREGLLGEIDVLVGTFSKALCSLGAYIVTEPIVREMLVNRMRTLLFTTALPPVNLRWSRFVLKRVREMDAKRENLLARSEQLRGGLRRRGYATGGTSQIVPLVVGDNDETVRLAARLRDAGIRVFAIRPPTVPRGTSRLRFSLHADLTEPDVDEVLSVL